MYEDYYVKQERKLVRKFARLMNGGKTTLDKYNHNGNATAIIDESINNYKKLIPELPYIGGKKNLLTNSIVIAIQMLALIKTLETHGVTKEKIGECIYRLVENERKMKSMILLLLSRTVFFSRWNINKFERGAIASQRRKYPEDWVYTMNNESKGMFELCFSECGICKLYKKLGYADYVPYLCLTDYTTPPGMRIRLERSTTIGNGGEVCDFRIIKNGKPVQGWPPHNLEEFNL